MSKIETSIIIVSYNTKDLLLACLDSVVEHAHSAQVIVSDNGSSDGTQDAVKSFAKKHKQVELVENNANLGFAKGNNVGRLHAKGEYILFLNPDTLLHKDSLSESITFFKKNRGVGALTCRVELPSGKLDLDTRRAFPTPLVALTHFSGLDRLFPHSRLFSRYWYGWMSEDQTHEVEVLQGAFFLTTKNILDRVGWFSEDYFLDGEDIDLSWKIHNAGYKLMYYPEVKITHVKKASKKKNKSLRSVTGGMQAMKIFYKKRLSAQYPFFVSWIVIFGINVLKAIRILKYYLTKTLS